MNEKRDQCDRGPSDPTPEQIRERAAQVRKRWSARMTVRRLVSGLPSWSPPLVGTIDILRELNARKE